MKEQGDCVLPAKDEDRQTGLVWNKINVRMFV